MSKAKLAESKKKSVGSKHKGSELELFEGFAADKKSFTKPSETGPI